MKILNCIVYYDNPMELEKYLHEVGTMDSLEMDISITINKNNRDSVYQLRNAWHGRGELIFLNYDKNVGYLNAMLYPIQVLDLNKYKYVILSNTDIHYCDPDFFNKLKKKTYDQDIGCIAPNIYEPYNDIYCNPHYKERIEKSKYIRLSKIFSCFPLAKLYLWMAGFKSSHKRRVADIKPSHVYAPHGSYMIFTRKFVKKFSGFIYPVILYSEEACIGEMLRRYKMNCYYDPDLKVEHMESTVTGVINQKNRFKMWKESIDYILSEFY